MQQQNKLKMIISKLKLKELEVVDRLSNRHNDYVIRCITDPTTFKFIAVNGDWSNVTGYSEKECIGKSWVDFIPEKDKNKIIQESQTLVKNDEGYDEFTCDIIGLNNKPISVRWKARFYPELNATVSIGKVSKKSVKNLEK